MARHIAVGIDIGTYHIKVIVASAEATSDKSMPKIIGLGQAESKGLRHGYVINQVEAIKSIQIAIRQAEKMAGVKISKAFLAVGGVGLGSNYCQRFHCYIKS